MENWPGVTYDETRRSWILRCRGRGCYYAVTVASEQAGLQEEKSHKCPMVGQTKIAWTVYGPSLLEQSWAELDRITALLIEGDRSEVNIGYARGLAFMISLFMVPYLTTPAEVAKEAKHRYKMKAAGEEYQTPGLGTRKYEPPPADYKTDRVNTPQRAKVMDSKPKGKQLSDVEIAAIKNAADMFPHAELAKLYGITVERIAEIVAK